MHNFVKIAAAVGVAGIIGMGSVTKSEARNGRNAAAVGGFVAGAVVGSAIANSANSGYYYNDGYYGGSGYYAEPGYAYSPGYESYSYEPAPSYAAPRGHTRAVAPNCWQYSDSSSSGYCGTRSTPSF